jgi:hypothetical protein
MCNDCQRWHNSLPVAAQAQAMSIKRMPLQSELDEMALHKFRKAKLITDSKKLEAMMPTWIKHHNTVSAIPKRKEFIPGLPPQFPGWVTQQNKDSLSFFKSYWSK